MSHLKRAIFWGGQNMLVCMRFKKNTSCIRPATIKFWSGNITHIHTQTCTFYRKVRDAETLTHHRGLERSCSWLSVLTFCQHNHQFHYYLRCVTWKIPRHLFNSLCPPLSLHQCGGRTIICFVCQMIGMLKYR